MSNVAGINIADYAAKKAAGLLAIAKVGDAYAISVKVFSTESGEEQSPQVYGLTLRELDMQKDELIKAAEDLQLLITDLTALDMP